MCFLLQSFAFGEQFRIKAAFKIFQSVLGFSGSFILYATVPSLQLSIGEQKLPNA